ncbi:MAG: DsrE/DsrF/DrsH-like family protein [Candidatus Thiodiazotropha sp. (ex Lucinoma borealis)]|nr:DsrE/DsrF/DrsH-like family protein [Candidatus Thiodiazotropha sp. (ex Lucinoma borealis)]
MILRSHDMSSTLPVVDNPTADLNNWFDQRFDEKMAEREAAHVPSMTIISTKGTLDMAYPPFILASTAAALGWDVSIFFTFYGLNLLKRDLDLKVSPLGNPAMPMKLPEGPAWIKGKDIPMPTSVMTLIPGFEKMATGMMMKTMDNKGIARIDQLREMCIEADVKLVACQMTVDLFDYAKEEFIPEIEEWVGAASFLPRALKADVNLFV